MDHIHAHFVLKHNLHILTEQERKCEEGSLLMQLDPIISILLPINIHVLAHNLPVYVKAFPKDSN